MHQSDWEKLLNKVNLNCNNILQYYCFTLFLINNAALVSIRDFFFFFKNIQIKILLTLTFLNGNARASYVTIRN